MVSVWFYGLALIMKLIQCTINKPRGCHSYVPAITGSVQGNHGIFTDFFIMMHNTNKRRNVKHVKWQCTLKNDAINISSTVQLWTHPCVKSTPLSGLGDSLFQNKTKLDECCSATTSTSLSDRYKLCLKHKTYVKCDFNSDLLNT